MDMQTADIMLLLHIVQTTDITATRRATHTFAW